MNLSSMSMNDTRMCAEEEVNLNEKWILEIKTKKKINSIHVNDTFM